MKGGRVHAAGLVALALGAACTQVRQPGAPTPLAVLPSRASADAPVRVEIAGRDFDAAVATDFGGGPGAGVQAGFSAWLEPSAAGSAAPLGGVALTPRRSLLATVPAGLVPGTYRLVVVDPAGRRGALERAYRVVSSPGSVARFAVTLDEAPRVGIPFSVTVTAVDAGGALVDGFDGAVTLSDTAGALTAQAFGRLVYGRGQGRVTIAAPLAGDALVVSDGAGRSGASPPFSVVAGPPMTLVFTSAPVTAVAGACSPRLELALRDGTGAPAVADVAVAVELQAERADVLTYSDPGCTQAAGAVTIPGGAAGAALHFRAASPGTFRLRALSTRFPGAVQAETATP